MAIFILFVLFFVTFFPHNEMVSISNSSIIIIISIGISTKDLTHHISMDEQNKDDWQNTILSTKIRPKIKYKKIWVFMATYAHMLW